MKRIIALCLMLVLLLSACAPAAEEDIAPNTNVPVIEDTDQTTGPDALPPAGEEGTNTTPDTPSEPETKPEDNKPETPTTPGTGNTQPEQPTPTPDSEPEQQPEREPEEEIPDYTTTCMTFNVLAYNTGGSTDFAHPQTRAPWVLDTITKYDPDLLGCQEVVRKGSATENYDMYTYLTTNLAKKGYACSGLMDSKTKAGSTVKVGDYTIASGLLIFWKKDRFELKDYGARVYNNDPGRHFQWVKLYDKQERITILMTNTHMSINPNKDVKAGDALRAQQGNELYQFWNANCKGDMALYATGDYNHKTDSTAFGNMTKGKFVSTRDVSQGSNANSGVDHVLINGEIQDCFAYHRCEETYEPAGVTKPPISNRNLQFSPSDHFAIMTYCSNAYRE